MVAAIRCFHAGNALNVYLEQQQSYSNNIGVMFHGCITCKNDTCCFYCTTIEQDSVKEHLLKLGDLQITMSLGLTVDCCF